jgi:hypothetical protein
MIFDMGNHTGRVQLIFNKIKVLPVISIAFIVLFFCITFVCNAHTQIIAEDFDYPMLYKFSTNFTNSAFKNYLIYHGTEIVQAEKKKSNVQKIIEDDTTKPNNKLTIRDSQDGETALICLSLDNYNVNVKIVVFNLLGKKVMDVWNGQAIDEPCPSEYAIQKSRLSNGMYLVVAQSANFRLVGKFIVSR